MHGQLNLSRDVMNMGMTYLLRDVMQQLDDSCMVDKIFLKNKTIGPMVAIIHIIAANQNLHTVFKQEIACTIRSYVS